MAGNSPDFRQVPSNLVPSLDSRSYQAAEQPVWLNKQSLSGYCSAVIPAQDMYFKWGTRDWTLSTLGLNAPSAPDLPRSDFQFLFDNERLIRSPLKQYIPWITTPTLVPIFPVLNYACCNWTGPLIGANQSVQNMRWHLAYVNSIDAFNATIDSNANSTSLADLIAANQVSSPLDTVDSYTESGGLMQPDGTWLDPGDAQGWVLCLMSYVIQDYVNPSGDSDANQFEIDWHCYAAYQLHPENQKYYASAPDTVQLPDPILDKDGNDVTPLAFLNCLERNTWIPIHNPLSFPIHLIQTRPIGP